MSGVSPRLCGHGECRISLKAGVYVPLRQVQLDPRSGFLGGARPVWLSFVQPAPEERPGPRSSRTRADPDADRPRDPELHEQADQAPARPRLAEEFLPQSCPPTPRPRSSTTSATHTPSTRTRRRPSTRRTRGTGRGMGSRHRQRLPDDTSRRDHRERDARSAGRSTCAGRSRSRTRAACVPHDARETPAAVVKRTARPGVSAGSERNHRRADRDGADGGAREDGAVAYRRFSPRSWESSFSSWCSSTSCFRRVIRPSGASRRWPTGVDRQPRRARIRPRA